MDRREFLATAIAASVSPVLPSSAHSVTGFALAPAPDQVVTRLLALQDRAVREVHRVTGVPRYQLGADGVERDTWMDQVNAGLSEVIEKENA